jgi:hypothetical protein
MRARHEPIERADDVAVCEDPMEARRTEPAISVSSAPAPWRDLILLVWKVPGKLTRDNLTAFHRLGRRLLSRPSDRAETTQACKTGMEGGQDAWQQLSVSTCPV